MIAIVDDDPTHQTSGRLSGGSGDDVLTGDPQDDLLDGGPGADAMAGGASNDIGPGDDRLVGLDGDDRLIGGREAVRYDTTATADIELGGDGDDHLQTGPNGRADGGPGADQLAGRDGARLTGGPGREELVAYRAHGGATLHAAGDGERDIVRCTANALPRAETSTPATSRSAAALLPVVRAPAGSSCSVTTARAPGRLSSSSPAPTTLAPADRWSPSGPVVASSHATGTRSGSGIAARFTCAPRVPGSGLPTPGGPSPSP
jgi:hypothetical protein